MTITSGAPRGNRSLSRPAGGVLQGLASEARDAVGKCHSAGVTLVDGRKVTWHAGTDQVAADLERAQSDAGEGPSFDALRFLQIFNVSSIPETKEWPAFRDTAADHGIVSSLSAPLLRWGRALGTLNLYSRVANGFDECEQLAMDFASRAAAAVLAHRGDRS